MRYSELGVFCTKSSHVVLEYPNGPGRVSKVKCGEICNNIPAMHNIVSGASTSLLQACNTDGLLLGLLDRQYQSLLHAVAFAICSRCAVEANQNGDLT
jgi:hypothetical protein